MMKRLLLIILFLLLSPLVVHSEIDFTQIKGLYSIVHDRQHLSPLHGFIWWKSHYVEHLYRFGNPEDNTIALIKELFYLNPWDDYTFDCTILPNKPVAYFSPRTIGLIVQKLETFSESAISRREELLKNVLQTDLQYDSLCEKSRQEKERLQKKYAAEITEQRRHIDDGQNKKHSIGQKKKDLSVSKAEMEQKLNQLRQQKNVLKKKRPAQEWQKKLTHKEEEIKDMQARLAAHTAELDSCNKTAKGVKQQMQQGMSAIRAIENKIKNSVLDPDALEKLVHIMCGALRESQSTYPPYMLHNILLAFLWQKAERKRDFIDYFSAVLPPTALNETRILQKNSPEQKQWLDDSYCLHRYSDVEQVLSDGGKQEHEFDEVSRNYEKLTAAFYAYTVFSSVFPPQLIPGWTMYKGNKFADCGSTALRNFLNNLIYDDQKGAFDIALLKRACKVHPKLEHFYHEYGAVEKIETQQARDAWAVVTSDLNEPDQIDDRIDYKSSEQSGVCEIAARSGIANMTRVLNKLLGVKSITELAERLNSKTNKKISVDFRPDENPNFGIFTIAIDGNKTCFWHFEPRHFYVISGPHYYTTHKAIDDFMQATLPQADGAASRENSYRYNLHLLYRNKEKIRGLLLEHVAKDDEMSSSLLCWCLALFDLRRDEEKIALIFTILHRTHLRENPHLFSLLERVRKAYPEDQEVYYKGIVQAILSSGVYECEGYPYQKHFLQIAQEAIGIICAKFPVIIPQTIDYILAYEAKKFYPILKKRELTAQQILTILNKRIVPLYDKAKERIAAMWSLLSEKMQCAIITAVYENNIEELFDCIKKLQCIAR